jgi:adenylate kinase family enzyme
MDNGIQIVIVGAAGTGKTTVAQEIVDTLRNLGFSVKWDVKPDHNTEQEARKEGIERLRSIESVSDKSPIVVKEVQARKDFNASLNYRVQEYTNKKKG